MWPCRWRIRTRDPEASWASGVLRETNQAYYTIPRRRSAPSQVMRRQDRPTPSLPADTARFGQGFLPGLVCCLVLAAGTLAAYRGIFAVPLISDDVSSITDNASIRQLWPLWRALSPPADTPVGGKAAAQSLLCPQLRRRPNSGGRLSRGQPADPGVFGMDAVRSDQAHSSEPGPKRAVRPRCGCPCACGQRDLDVAPGADRVRDLHIPEGRIADGAVLPAGALLLCARGAGGHPPRPPVLVCALGGGLPSGSLHQGSDRHGAAHGVALRPHVRLGRLSPGPGGGTGRCMRPWPAQRFRSATA